MIINKDITVRPNRIERSGLTPEREKEILASLLQDLRGHSRICDMKLAGVDLWDQFVVPDTAQYTDVFSVNRAEKELPEEMKENFFRFIKNGLTSETERGGYVLEARSGNAVWVDEDTERLAHAYLDIKGCGGGAQELIDGLIKPGKGPIANGGLTHFLSVDGEDSSYLIELRLPFSNVYVFQCLVTLETTTKEEYLDYLIRTEQAYGQEAAEVIADTQQKMRAPYGFGISTRFELILIDGPEGHKEAQFTAGVVNNILRQLTGTLLVRSSLVVSSQNPEGVADHRFDTNDHGSDVVFIDPAVGTGMAAVGRLDPLLFQLISTEEEVKTDE